MCGKPTKIYNELLKMYKGLRWAAHGKKEKKKEVEVVVGLER